MDLGLRLRLRPAKAMAPIASKADMPPMAPPAIAPLCDFDFDCDFDGVPVVTGLAVIWRTGALRNIKSDIEKGVSNKQT